MNNRTFDDEAYKMSALTSRRTNSPDFSAKLPFLVIQPCLVYFDTNKPHFFLLQNVWIVWNCMDYEKTNEQIPRVFVAPLQFH